MKRTTVFRSLTATILLYAASLFFLSANAQEKEKVDSLNRLIQRVATDSGRYSLLLDLYAVQINTPLEAFVTLQKALSLAQKMSDRKKQGAVYSRLAYIYNKTGDPVKSAQKLVEALAIFESIGDSVSIAAINNNLGIVYKDQANYEEALKRFEKALGIWDRQNFKSGKARVLTNVAEIYLKQNRVEAALPLYSQAEIVCKEIGDEQFLSTVFKGMGHAYADQLDYKRALEFYNSAFLVTKKFNLGSTQAEILIDQSAVHLSLGKQPLALSLAEEALRISRSTKYKLGMMNSYNGLAMVYGKMKNYEKAEHYQNLFLTLKDSIRNSETMSKIQNLTYAHELDKKEAELVLLNQQHQVDLFKRNAYALSGILFLISIVLFLGFQRVRIKRKLDIQHHDLRLKEQQLEFLKIGLLEKSDLLEKVTQELEQLNADRPQESLQIDNYSKILASHILTPEDWENFKAAFEEVHPNFFSKLRFKYGEITNAELRLCALVKLNLSAKEAARMLGVSPESVKQSRYRLKKKLDLGETSLEDFVKKLT